MKQKITLILTSILLYLIVLPVKAQVNPIKQFSEDPVQFLDEVKTMLEVTNMEKKDVKLFMEEFSKAWNTPKYTNNLKKATYSSFNLMVKKKMRILPEYKSYMSCLINFVNSNQSEDNFMTWQECINKILNGKNTRYYSDYLEMSQNLFASNTFYKSAVVEFKSNNNKYIFEYDSIPKVIFPKLDLKCYNNHNDSGIIYNTRGTYYPYTGIFIGETGKVDWKRVGLPDNKVWAELKRYQIVLKTSGFSADSVVFYNKNYFEKPLVGALTEKVISEREDIISYPRFDSYSKRMPIPSIAKDVDYEGGFFQRGAKFLGSGNKEEDAKLVFKKDGKRFLVVGAKLIGITEDKFTSENANITFYLDKDSITHPSVNMKYMIKDRVLSLVRTSEGVSKSPFLDSFHDVDMYFEELVWKVEEPKINIKMLVGNSSEDALFESSSYFRTNRYEQVQGMDQMNPLIKLRDYDKANGSKRKFTGADYAKYLRFGLKDVAPSLIRLSVLGFISYKPEDDIIQLNDKLFTYIAARAGQLDYDVIQFPSVIRGGNNATLDLTNYDMTIYGVKQVAMSDSQNVFVYPTDQTVILKRNRDFAFAGVIRAGKFDFFGKEFTFDYDKFMIDLKNVDSLRITVKSIEKDVYGEFPPVRVKTVLEKINGSLEIDNPKNKSGRKEYPNYPIFNSFKESFAYYDKKSIQNGKYQRDQFYFKLEPFTIDSLDNFTNAGLTFKGELVSAGIFPTFKETLRLQPDYSLGFVAQTPPAGYSMYGDKGTYTASINLSNKGLKGDGTLKYVTSTIVSPDFTFLPDSTNCIAKTFDVKEQKSSPEFPQVHGDSVKVHWEPKRDVLYANNFKDRKFNTYNKQAEFSGLYSLTPKQLFGNGTADFSTAKLDAIYIKFKSNAFDSDTANFSLKSEEAATLAFATNNVKAHIDFTKRMGEFKSNGKGSIVKFPVNQYICFMDNFKWFMDNSQIELGSDKKPAKQSDLELEGPEFISVHPKQDSLRFQSPAARYDLKKYIITAREVKYMNVADARIYPDSGLVVIKKEAVMQTFNNAKIVANAVTKYHNLYNCTVNVLARKNYSGSGSYDYVDETKNKLTFYFSNISVDTTYQTYAETDIADASNFKLSPMFEYKGKVKLRASAQYLVFDGAVRIKHDCAKISKAWLKFESEVNPNEIYIPIGKNLTDINGKPIAASMMVTTDSTHFYSAFLSPKETANDPSVLPADGFLFFDKTSKEYRISNKEKLVESALPGNYLSLSTINCKVYGEGKIDLGGDFGQVKIESAGNATHYTIPDSVSFDLLMSMNFFFSDDAMNKMADHVENTIELLSTDFSKKTFEKGMREFLGKEQADKLISQLNLYGSYKKMPDELNKTFFFTDVKMKWNKETRSYTSTGKIGIGNIYKKQLNKYVNGRIEIVKKRGGDILNIYLELDQNNWYYFNYTRNMMLAVSSNEDFNNIIKGLKSDKREKAGDKDKKEPNYSYNICPPSKKTQFLRKTQSAEE